MQFTLTAIEGCFCSEDEGKHQHPAPGLRRIVILRSRGAAQTFPRRM